VECEENFFSAIFKMLNVSWIILVTPDN